MYTAYTTRTLTLSGISNYSVEESSGQWTERGWLEMERVSEEL